MHANNIKHHDNDEELEDIEALRRAAMESINNKKMKEATTAHPTFHSHSQPTENLYAPPSQQQQHPAYVHATSSFPPARPPRLQQFHMRPRFHSNHNTMNFPPHYGAPFHPRPVQPPIMHPDFVPHANPQFQPIFQPDYIPPQSMDFIPTIPARLSPRSLEFVESNKIALMNAQNKKRSRSKSPNGRRRYSRDSRSRSRSPARAPYKRRSPNGPSNRNIKRYRSKSPNNNNQALRNRKTSSEKEIPNRLHKNRNNNRRNNTWRNNNGNKFDRRRSESDNDEEESIQPSQKSTQNERENNDKQKVEMVVATKEVASPIIEENETPTSTVEDKQQESSQDSAREKTQDELEDELLASDDDLAIDIGVDENELDFLNDDSESENEGRFKDKPSLSSNKTSAKSSTKEYGDSKAYNKSTLRDDRYKRKEYGSRSSPVYKKSLRNEENKKPLFKSTFKSVEAEKTNVEAASKRSEKQITTIKSTVMKADSNTKLSEKPTSSISKIDGTSKSSLEPSKRKIRERLGEYIGAKAKLTEGSKTFASSKQVKRRLYKPTKRQVVLKLSQISS